MEGKVETMWESLKNQYPHIPGRVEERFSDLPSLTLLDDVFLQQAGVREGAERDAVVRSVQQLLQNENFAVLHPHKLINDPIHGTIRLHPLAVIIMNTPQFQRLHYIKQLSVQYYVYPSAGYSRFEHSVGVYHLAGKLVNILKDQQPELGITAIDAMCVQLAGLCHDLGHGPFSHLFDGTIIPTLLGKSSPEMRERYEHWTHEVASAALIDVICYSDQSKVVRREIAEWGVCKKDIEFIKSLIKGESEPRRTGRPATKSFLYEIVANDRSGMDVDKWDYLVRDSYHLGLKCGFDPDRLMYHMRVMEIARGGDKKKHICVRRKEQDSVYSMFHTRFELYRKALQHPVVNGVEMMVAEAIVGAGEHLRIDGKTLLECLGDVEAYTKLNDGILPQILESKKRALKRPKKLLERIQKRDLWKCVVQAVIPPRKKGEKSTEHLCDKIAEEIKEACDLQNLQFRLKVKTRNFGKKEKNPLETIGFYDKENPSKATLFKKGARSAILPKEFQQSILFVYCTSERKKLEGRATDVCKKLKEILRQHRLNVFI